MTDPAAAAAGVGASAAHRRCVNARCLVVTAFAVSRIVFYLLGVRFDGGPLDWSWQLLDPALLRHDLARSLWHLHSQPPLFNLVVGCALKLWPPNPLPLLHAALMGCGLALACSMFALLRRLSVEEPVAAVAAILFVVSPPAILFENYLSYTWPVAAMLCLAGLLLHRFVTAGRLRDGFSFFLVLACVTLTMAFFHLVWVLAAVLLVLAWGRLDRRAVLKAAAVPVLLVVAWYAKNLALFGSFSASSWLGMNLARVAEGNLTEAQKRELVDDEVTSRLVLKKPFLPITAYASAERLAALHSNPALDAAFKSNGEPNLNHRLYVPVAKQFLADVFAIAWQDPRPYLSGVAQAAALFYSPSDQYWLLEGNRARLGVYARAFDLVVCGDFLGGTGHIGLFIVLVLAAVVVGGVPLVAALRRLQPLISAARVVVTGFLLMTTLYAVMAGCLLDFGENCRFRFLIDPLVVVLAIAACFPRLRAWRALFECHQASVSGTRNGSFTSDDVVATGGLEPLP